MYISFSAWCYALFPLFSSSLLCGVEDGTPQNTFLLRQRPACVSASEIGASAAPSASWRLRRLRLLVRPPLFCAGSSLLPRGASQTYLVFRLCPQSALSGLPYLVTANSLFKEQIEFLPSDRLWLIHVVSCLKKNFKCYIGSIRQTLILKAQTSHNIDFSPKDLEELCNTDTLFLVNLHSNLGTRIGCKYHTYKAAKNEDCFKCTCFKQI